MKKQVIIIDTSAILSGKPIHFPNARLVTASGVSDELTPGGRDYRTFELLIEKGLEIHMPSKESLHVVKKTSEQTGDDRRLSTADVETIALALDINREPETEAMILTDDYSIQNVASTLQIRFEGFSQKGITKKFKWVSRCPGCGKHFNKRTDSCPICGTTTRNFPRNKTNL
jgi:UPF0271 protein